VHIGEYAETSAKDLEEFHVKRRPRTTVRAEVAAELLDGWMFVQLLKFDEGERQHRRIRAHLATAAALPLADCPCLTCECLRGQVSGA
jgi:hypothetical protein